MSIKINGNTGYESITKEDGSEVRIVPSLYLNGTEITASGGGGSDPGDTKKVCEFKDCGVYAASKYTGYDIINVSVSNWETVDNIPDNYYEINSNNEYNVSDLADYDGVVVTKASEPEPEPEPEITTQVLDVTFPDSDGYQSNFSVTSYKVENISSSADKTALNSLTVKCIGSYDVGDSLNSDPVSFELSIPDFSQSVVTEGLEIGLTHNNKIYGHSVDVTWSATINSQNQIVITVTEIKSTQKPSTDTPNDFRVSFSIQRQYRKITQTFITYPASSWSLRSSNSISQSDVIENLVVNNDALIQGNLFVNGYINDLSWYWDSIAINTVETDLGVGFLAKITDLVFKINNEQVLVSTLQLSPGSSYKESSYSIIWFPTGVLKIDADDITEISGSIQILRYE